MKNQVELEIFILASLIAFFGNLFLFLCVGLPAIQNQGYFAGDLDRYGEMKFEFPLMCFTLVCSVIFVIYAFVLIFFLKNDEIDR